MQEMQPERDTDNATPYKQQSQISKNPDRCGGVGAENIKEPYRCVWPPAICTVGVGGCVSDSCLRHNDSYHRNKTLLAHSFCQLNQTAGQKEFPKEASTPTSTQNRLSGQLTVNGAKRLVQQQPLEMLSFIH